MTERKVDHITPTPMVYYDEFKQEIDNKDYLAAFLDLAQSKIDVNQKMEYFIDHLDNLISEASQFSFRSFIWDKLIKNYYVNLTQEQKQHFKSKVLRARERNYTKLNAEIAVLRHNLAYNPDDAGLQENLNTKLDQVEEWNQDARDFQKVFV